MISWQSRCIQVCWNEFKWVPVRPREFNWSPPLHFRPIFLSIFRWLYRYVYSTYIYIYKCVWLSLLPRSYQSRSAACLATSTPRPSSSKRRLDYILLIIKMAFSQLLVAVRPRCITVRSTVGRYSNMFNILTITGHRFGHQTRLDESSGRNAIIFLCEIAVRVYLVFSKIGETLHIHKYVLKHNCLNKACQFSEKNRSACGKPETS